MVIPHRFVMRIKQGNTYTAHLMVSGHSKYSNHVRCALQIAQLARPSLCLRTSPPYRAPVPACPACGFWPVFLTVKSYFSSSWSFPGMLLPWEPPGAAWVWGRKGLWIKAHRDCCSHNNSGPATMPAPRTDADSRGKRKEFMGSLLLCPTAGQVGEMPCFNTFHYHGSIVFSETDRGARHHCFLVGLNKCMA